jgi:uncharacterized membrane protein YcaP (DUF421 family)
MPTVLRGAIVFFALLALFRITGRRSLAELSTFDFMLLLIISEATQQGMLGDDFSITNALVLVITLMFLDVLLSLVKRSSRRLDRVLEGTPMVLVENGQPLTDRMRKARVDVDDVLQSARSSHGLRNMSEIQFAILERSGGISIVPGERKSE